MKKLLLFITVISLTNIGNSIYGMEYRKQILSKQLKEAVLQGNTAKAEELLQSGAEVNRSDRWGNAPLHHAVGAKNIEMAKLLLDYKADINKGTYDRRYTPLSYAVDANNIEMAKLLLGHKANINKQDKWDWTPLLRAVWRNNIEMVQLLLENNADINLPNEEGQTPLHRAVLENNIGMVRLLLENNADPNIKDRNGKTALDVAKNDEIKAILLA